MSLPLIEMYHLVNFSFLTPLVANDNDPYSAPFAPTQRSAPPWTEVEP